MLELLPCGVVASATECKIDRMADREAETRKGLFRLMPELEVTKISPLTGGMSSTMLLVEANGSQGPEKFVARFPSEYVRQIFDDPAAKEAQVLIAARQVGLPVPGVLGLADAEDGRFLILEFLPGEATAAPHDVSSFLSQVAVNLARIHQIPFDADRFSFLLGTREGFVAPRGEMNKDLNEPALVEAMLEHGEPERGRNVLRHGDFWPGNLLWQEGQLTGIVDWENALRGPALADLGISRLDIAWILGFEAMEEFTAKYFEANRISRQGLAYWDLRACLRPARNLGEWVEPYASLGRPDIDEEHLKQVLLRFGEEALRRYLT